MLLIVELSGICSGETCCTWHHICNVSVVHMYGVPARSAARPQIRLLACCFWCMTPQLQLLQPCRSLPHIGAAVHRLQHNGWFGRYSVGYRQTSMAEAAAVAPAALPARHHMQERVLLYQYNQLLQVRLIYCRHTAAMYTLLTICKQLQHA
jgi:hypothetical protein